MCSSSSKDNSWFLALIFILDDGVILQIKETQEQEEKLFIQAEMPAISQPFECESHQTRNLSLVFLKRFFSFLFFKLFLAACVFAPACGLFLVAVTLGLLFITMPRLLILVASFVAEHGLQICRRQQLQHSSSVVAACRLCSCGAQTQLLCDMCDHSGLYPLHWQMDSQPLDHQVSPGSAYSW